MRAGGGTRTHTPQRTQAPKACASAIPPLRRRNGQEFRGERYCSIRRGFVLCLMLIAGPQALAQPVGHWTFEAPPDHLSDETWLENARLGALQLSGCSAALVSADGLAVTSATCVRASVARIMGDSVAAAGYYAESVDREVSLAPLTARQSVSMVDITGQNESDFMEDYTLEYHIMARDDSTRFWIYGFRPHRDIRLVLLPSTAASEFGQEKGVFPRHSVNFALIRVYAQDGTPYVTENYLAWSDRSPMAGESLFATDIPRYIPGLSASTVEVYTYNGTVSPPYTTLFGLYDLHFAHGAQGSWGLPSRWLSQQDMLELESPLNFATTGVCPQLGAAVYSQDLEVRGIAFDEVYSQGETRCVAMAAAGVLAVVKGIYNGDRIAQELEFQQIDDSNR